MSNRFGGSVVAPALVAGLLMGSAAGVGAWTFLYAGGASYLSNDPGACGNCHVMGDHLSAWTRSSHSAVATCNDCHTPPARLAKYVSKAGNGFRHSFGFTTGDYPDPLRITAGNRRITEAACRKCHDKLLVAVEPAGHAPAADAGGLACSGCHARVGHWTR